MEEKIIHSLEELFEYGVEVQKKQELAPIKLDGDFSLALHLILPLQWYIQPRRGGLPQNARCFQHSLKHLLCHFCAILNYCHQAV